MALATPVTINIMSRLSGSSLNPKSTCKSPTLIQVSEDSDGAGAQPAQPMKTRLRTKPAVTAPMDSVALTVRLCCVQIVMTTAASSGRRRMVHTSAFIRGSRLAGESRRTRVQNQAWNSDAAAGRGSSRARSDQRGGGARTSVRSNVQIWARPPESSSFRLVSALLRTEVRAPPRFYSLNSLGVLRRINSRPVPTVAPVFWLFVFRNCDAERGAQINLMLLFLHDYGAQGFAQHKFSHRFGLANALAVLGDRELFVFEVGAEHRLGIFGSLDGLGRHRRHAAEVINLLGDFDRVGEFFAGVLFQFARDVGVRSAFEHLAVHGVGDDGLVFTRQIFVEEVNHLFAGGLRF